MASIKVQVINESSVLNDTAVNDVVPALQTQVRDHFSHYWNDADLTFVAQYQQPDPSMWWLVILDDSDQANALGYHDLTSTGLPLGKVFAASDKKASLNWTVTASHELLEMLADPYIDLSVLVQSDGDSGVLYAYEVCDACESEDFAYDINGVKVSDFVLPSWFQSQSKDEKFDYLGKVSRPFELLSGGYISVFKFASAQGWTQIYGSRAKQTYGMRAPVGSRRERRRTPKSSWLLSSVDRAARGGDGDRTHLVQGADKVS